MTVKLLTIIMVTLIAAPASAFNDKWYECESNSDCKVVAGACGVWQAINTDYEKEYNDFFAMIEFDCVHIESSPKPNAICIKNKCVIEE